MTNTCVVCGKQFEAKTSRKKYCSKACYLREYYYNNRVALLAKDKRNYEKRKPKKAPLSEEELLAIQAERLAKRKQYQLEHKEYYAQKNKEWYQQHKYDKHTILAHRRAMDRYILKKIDTWHSTVTMISNAIADWHIQEIDNVQFEPTNQYSGINISITFKNNDITPITMNIHKSKFSTLDTMVQDIYEIVRFKLN